MAPTATLLLDFRLRGPGTDASGSNGWNQNCIEEEIGNVASMLTGRLLALRPLRPLGLRLMQDMPILR